MGEKKETASSDLTAAFKEPPKFDMSDLPEPPKIDSGKPKGSIFSKIFTKKDNSLLVKEFEAKTEKHTNTIDIPLPPIDIALDGKDKAASIEKPPVLQNQPSMPKLPEIKEMPKLDGLNMDAPVSLSTEGKQDSFFSKLFKKNEKKQSEPVPENFSKLASIPEPPGFNEDAEDGIEAPLEDEIREIPLPPADEPHVDDLFKRNDPVPQTPIAEEATEAPQTWDDVKNELDSTKKDLMDNGIISTDLHQEELAAPETSPEEEHKAEVVIDFSEGHAEKKEEPIPIEKVSGIGLATHKKLKKLKIKTADDLAKLDHEHISKKAKIPKHIAKKIVKNAQSLVKKKNDKLKIALPEEKTITTLIKELENEKTELNKLKKVSKKDELLVNGHEEIINLLDKLEKKKVELLEHEGKLSEKESLLSSYNETYRRDAEYIDKLKRRLDHDIRERTQYLIELEREFFKRGQDLAKRQSALEIKEKHNLDEEKSHKDRDAALKKKNHEIDSKQTTLDEKEKRLEKVMKELEKQELILNDRIKELDKREAEYEKKLSALEAHEKQANKTLDEKKKDLEKKEMQLLKVEKEVFAREKKIAAENRAIDYAETEIEKQKKKLEDAEFKQYLKDKLGEIRSGEGITIDDIEETRAIHVPDLTEKEETVYDLIEKCKSLAKAARTTEAKLFYNKIREKFYTLKFYSQDEKESVHNIIRGLYDEIHLAEMNKK